MLAGRKLLLADDSPTIQKVVELTFADEGVVVVSVGSGTEALAKLAENKPDVVLVDAFMPPPNGYEVCKHIKENAELRHIPVMLLVGSFEPFDEAEARRVGADDILTKPFQSIRRLIDRVGGLVSGKHDPDQVPTAELPNAPQEPEPERMSTGELELTTANTRPLPEGVGVDSLSNYAGASKTEVSSHEQLKSDRQAFTTNKEMETNISVPPESTLDTDVLLDLGDLPPGHSERPDDFVLDIDLDDAAPVAVAKSTSFSPTPAFVEPEATPGTVDWQLESEPGDLLLNRSTGELPSQPASSAKLDDTMEWMRQSSPVSAAAADETHGSQVPRTLERVFDEPVGEESRPAAPLRAGDLTPEQINMIARRAVEMLSEKVVQQIAWEVVPQLAELMIKRKLEENEPQPK